MVSALASAADVLAAGNPGVRRARFAAPVSLAVFPMDGITHQPQRTEFRNRATGPERARSVPAHSSNAITATAAPLAERTAPQLCDTPGNALPWQ